MAKNNKIFPEIVCMFICEKEKSVLNIKYEQRGKPFFVCLSTEWFGKEGEALVEATREEFLNYGINGDHVKWPDLGIEIPILELWKKAFLSTQRGIRHDAIDNIPDALKNSLSASVKTRLGKKVYAAHASEEEKDALKKRWGELLQKIGCQYKADVDAEKHCCNIYHLSEDLSGEFSHMLLDNRLRIGVAQKSLNLYLKYLWCLGEIEMPPPHCTMDNQILQKVYQSDDGVPKWTEMDSIGEYMCWISDAKKAAAKAGIESLVEWELYAWKPQ